MKHLKFNLSILTSSIFFFCQLALATTYSVSTSTDFKKWASDAQPGDVITLQPGTYSNWRTILFAADGTEASPIIYRASSQGDVTFTGTMLFNIKADWIIIENFDFVEVAKDTSPPAGVIYIRDSVNSRVTYCRFYSCGVTPTNGMSSIMLCAGSKTCRIDHCLFVGSLYGMIGSDVRQDQDWPKYIQIDHNTFQNSTTYCAMQTASGKYGNGSEATLYTVEYNTFKNLTGSAKEVICNKSSGNVYRFNTFQDLPNGFLSLRMGHDCRIESNTFTNCYGIRINGKRHKIINNMLYNIPRAFILVYGDIDEYSGTGCAGDCYVAAKDCIIAHNTAIASSRQFIMESHNFGYEPSIILPSGNKITNNIFVADYDKFIVSSLSNNEINTNIFRALDGQNPTGTLGTNYITEDPKFTGSELNSRLSTGSPAIDKGVTISELSITTDLDGNTRPQGTSNDIGAHEFVAIMIPMAPKNLRSLQ